MSVLAPDRVVGQILIAGCPAGEIPLPRETTDDWLSREGDPVRMAQVPEPYMTRPVEPELIERFGRDAATVGRAALEGTLSAVMTTSFTDRLASITTPSLVVGGSGDPMFGPDALRAGGRRAARPGAPRAARLRPRDPDSRHRASSRR